MKKSILLAVFVTAGIISSLRAQTFNKAKMDSLLSAFSVNDKAMLSLAISQNGSTIYSNAIGYSQITDAQKTPANVQTHYRIGSITKMFTAVMIFQLIEEHKLELTTPLSTFYPGLPNAGKITIANLLNHSSGLHNFTDDPGYMNMLSKKVTEAEMLAKFKTNPPDFEPGTKHAYSNTNFVLLGHIVEKLDKKPYSAALKSRIVTKIGLKSTYIGGKIGSADNEAQPYGWGGKWVPATETDMSIPGGAGAIVSTPTDLDTFINALFNGKLISEGSLAHMKDIKDNYGMAMFVTPFYDRMAYGHTGGIDGFQSDCIYFPGDKVAVSYIANGVNTSLNDFLIGVLSIVFNRPYAIPTFKSFAVKPEELDKYLGTYATTQLPIKITITKNEGHLMAQATGQGAFPLNPSAPDEFKFEPVGVVMVFDAAKNQMTLKQGGGVFIFTKEKQ